jgi:hypothetical protein
MAVLFEAPPGDSVVLPGSRQAKRSVWHDVKPVSGAGASQKCGCTVMGTPSRGASKPFTQGHFQSSAARAE